MSSSRFCLRSVASSTLLAAALALPATVGMAADVPNPALTYDVAAIGGLAVSDDASPDQTTALDDAEVRCMAKVVHHEAGNQPREGQLAVARTLVNRLKAGGGRFGDSICAVANQPGQFFKTSSYHPDEDSDGWHQAVDVSRAALNGEGEDNVRGAMFFRASYARANTFFRSRERVASIGDQVFYR